MTWKTWNLDYFGDSNSTDGLIIHGLRMAKENMMKRFFNYRLKNGFCKSKD